MYPAKVSLELSDLFRLELLSMSPLAWLAIVCLVIYLVGAISLWIAGKPWSVLAAASFFVGCLIWFLVTGLSGNTYADELVSVLVFQQITLMVFVPPFLLMGSPGRLLLRATPHRGLGRPVLRAAVGAYRSRTALVLLHPAMVVIIAALAFPTLYFTDAVSWFLALPGGHLILLTFFLVFGVIGAAPLWAVDPLPREPSFPVRLVDLFIEIQIHAVFGLLLLVNAGRMFSWYAEDPKDWGLTRELDQAIGGGLVWSYGTLPLIVVLVVTFSKWRVSDLRQAKRRQTQEDADLDAYNAYLAEMSGKEQK